MKRFLPAYLRLRRTWAWLLLLAALALALAFTPLFNLLAYEFCLALALAGSVASAHLGSVSVTALHRGEQGMLLTLGEPCPTLLVLLGRSIAANLLLLLLPLAIISLNALRVKNCDYLEGLAFFAMMPMLSVCIASCAGALWALAIPRPALATLAALLTLVASLLWGLLRFYDAPSIFGHDPFVGYFPGALYDEDVAIRLPFVVYRLYNLAWLLGIALAAAHFLDPATLRLGASRFRPGRWLTPAALVALAAGVLLLLLRAPLGFAVDGEHIAKVLGGVRRSAHFTIHHPEEMPALEVDLLAQDHEFRYTQLARLFGSSPAHITSFIFRSSDEKRRLMGAGRTFIAKPWRNEVYLQQEPFPHHVLKHELAHVFAGLFGDRLFGVSLRWRHRPLPHPVVNVGLIEGVAVAADWRPYLEEMDGHQMASALVQLGLAPPPEALFGYGFLAHAASRSYVLSGSFCRYLAGRHGFGKLTAVYESGGDFEAVYQRPLADLLQDWSRFIATVSVPDRELQLARERFRRPSILRRVCSHEVANLIADSEQALARRKPREAARLVERVCDHDPGEPAHLLRWIGAEAAAGATTRAMDLGRRLLAHPSLSKPMRRRALEQIGDLQWLAGQRSAAASSYADAARQAALPFDRRVLHIKRWALEQPDAVRTLVRRYLVPPPGAVREAGLDVHLAHDLATTLPHSGLGLFLVAKQLAARAHYRDAASVLEQAMALGLPNQDFIIDGYRLLGRCQYASQQYFEAHATFVALDKTRGLCAGMRLEARDWIERIRWRTGGAVARSTRPRRREECPPALSTTCPAGTTAERALRPARRPPAPPGPAICKASVREDASTARGTDVAR